jgi:hypothetical protein
VWRVYTGVTHCVFDQIPNLQNCFTTTNKNLGRERASDRLTPAAMSLYKSIFKKSRHLGLESISYLVHAEGIQTSVNVAGEYKLDLADPLLHRLSLRLGSLVVLQRSNLWLDNNKNIVSTAQYLYD